MLHLPFALYLPGPQVQELVLVLVVVVVTVVGEYVLVVVVVVGDPSPAPPLGAVAEVVEVGEYSLRTLFLKSVVAPPVVVPSNDSTIGVSRSSKSFLSRMPTPLA